MSDATQEDRIMVVYQIIKLIKMTEFMKSSGIVSCNYPFCFCSIPLTDLKTKTSTIKYLFKVIHLTII